MSENESSGEDMRSLCVQNDVWRLLNELNDEMLKFAYLNWIELIEMNFKTALLFRWRVWLRARNITEHSGWLGCGQYGNNNANVYAGNVPNNISISTSWMDE